MCIFLEKKKKTKLQARWKIVTEYIFFGWECNGHSNLYVHYKATETGAVQANIKMHLEKVYLAILDTKMYVRGMNSYN